MADGLAVDLDTLLEAAQVVAGLGDRIAELPVAGALHRTADALAGGRLAVAVAADAEASGWTQAAAALTDLLAEHAAAWSTPPPPTGAWTRVWASRPPRSHDPHRRPPAAVGARSLGSGGEGAA